MNDGIFKAEIDKIMEAKGQTRGIAIQSHGDFIRERKGEESLKRVEERMKELGYPFRFSEIEKMKFYPIGLEVVVLLVSREILELGEEDFREMGAFESKSSLLIKVFMKYFVSIPAVADQAPKMWSKNYTIGRLKVKELSEKGRYVSLVLKDFNLHPLHCITLEGYFPSVVKMIVNEPVTCQEVKCVHRGDDHHEFLLKW